ncbi:hypothetical protein DACRYDRAFT_108326 [Dacryopinax primogenitus]|uniref:Chromo domain-containing protein n=1 Tax=Dacryopinax primogenitus (strain DJM 731) TaxID=1858805 RepID=M5FX36_DACPD|nr:uncharacterized protein DACRYDRAFT_108326 [Dacryopinax primogenitus]EJU00989.1 hypothetical protein DACRYDRAFT_108326 [Dacryopinax primogenitus]
MSNHNNVGSTGPSEGGDNTFEVAAEAVEDKPQEDKKPGDKKTYPGWSYLVKWAGFSDSENTWEHQDQFNQDTEALLKRFWVGTGSDQDHEHYEFGYRVDATKGWIEEEKKRFRLIKEKEQRKEKKKLVKKLVDQREGIRNQSKTKEAKGKTIASRSAEATRQLPAPKAPAPQLRTSGKKRSGNKSKSKSAEAPSDSEILADDPMSASSKRKTRQKSMSYRDDTEMDEDEFSEEESTSPKLGLKCSRISQVKSASPVEEDNAHTRRQSLREKIADKARDSAIHKLQEGRARHKNMVEHPAEHHDPQSTATSVQPKEKRTFAQPTRLWSSNIAPKQAPAEAPARAVSPEDATPEVLTIPVGVDGRDMKDLFGDSPPASDTEPAPDDQAKAADQTTTPKTAGPKSWKESRIKFYEPQVNNPAQAPENEGGVSHPPFTARQKIISRLMGTSGEGPDDTTLEDATAEDGVKLEETLPDYDEGDNPLPVHDDLPVINQVRTTHESPQAAGGHPVTPDDVSDVPTKQLPQQIVDLTNIRSDQPEPVELMDSSDIDEREGCLDRDAMEVDGGQQRGVSNVAGATSSENFLVTIYSGEEVIAQVKLAQVSAGRKLAPKLTFLIRDHRLDIVSFYMKPVILRMLEHAKVLQTGLFVVSTGQTTDGANSLFSNFVHWLRDLSVVAGAYVEQTNEKKKRVMLLFHSSNFEVAQTCQVPPWKSWDGIIIAAVELPDTAAWSRNIDVISAGQGTKASVGNTGAVSYAIEKLLFPRTVLENDMKGKAYCILPDLTNSDPFLTEDLRSLESALGHFRASSRRLGEIIDQEAFIFIHRKTMRVVGFGDQMEELIRVRKYPRVYFYCIGLGDPLHNDPVTEAQPRLISIGGGIVTFTPQALLEDPLAVVQLVNDLSKMQGWQCYIIPPVLAAIQDFKDPQNERQTWALVTLILATSKTEDRLILTESMDRILQRLRAKQETTVQTTEQPLNENHLLEEMAYMWTVGQFQLLEADPGKLLDLCRAVATEGKPSIDMNDVIKNVFEDMLSMQSQPKLLESYRRFVVITSAGREGRDTYQYRLDCCTVSEFWSSAKATFAREQELAFVQTPPLENMDLDEM